MTLLIPPTIQGAIDAIQGLRREPVTLPEELRPHDARLADLDAQIADLDQHLATARHDRDQHAAESEADSGELAEAEANALVDGTAAPSKKLRDRVQKSDEQQRIFGLRIRGLEARQRKLLSARETAVQEYQRATESWSQGEVAKAKACILTLVQQFISEIAEPLAIGRAHGNTTIDAMMRYAQLTSMGTAHDLWQPVSSHAWRRNPVMASTANHHAAILARCDQAVRRTTRRAVHTAVQTTEE